MTVEKAVKILLYNIPWTNEKSDDHNHLVTNEFELTVDHDYFDQAIAVIFHMPDLTFNEIMSLKSKKRKGQFWVFWSMECEQHYEWQYNKEILSLFDITATYKFDADIPVPYILPFYDRLLKRAPVAKTGFINAFISSDFNLSQRKRYLKELMNEVEINSYGKIFNNIKVPNDIGPPSKLNIISQYKFTIAFENAQAHDYVTEKFFEPLIMGSIPIYLGAPNIDEFAPGNNCFINVNNFNSIKELAAYLLELDSDSSLYDKMLEWKSQPFRDAFTSKFNTIQVHELKRLCDLLKIKIDRISKS